MACQTRAGCSGISRWWIPRPLTASTTALTTAGVAAIVPASPMPLAPSLHHREIGRDQLVVVVAADHRWTHRRTALRSHHLAETRLVSREIGSGTRAVFEAALSARGLAMAEPILELSSSVAIRNAVAAGVGPTVISELAVADDVASGRLVAVPVADLDLSRAFTAVWRSNPAPALLEWLCPSGETVRPRADQ